MKTDWDSLLPSTSPEAARRLLGCILERQIGPHRLRGRIVETEAYAPHDAASHSYRGRTPRTDVMFGPPGRLYVYFTYGMHYCCNVVVGPEGDGSAVLIRALEPLEGQELMRQNRRNDQTGQLTNGPAKLCQALMIDKTFNGHDLDEPPLRLRLMPPLPKSAVATGPRIGITRERGKPWRFYERGNPCVSGRSR